MRLSPSLAFPLLLGSAVSANIATGWLGGAAGVIDEVLDLGSGIVSNHDVPSAKDGDIRIMDSWSYVDCGLATDAVQLRSIKVSPDPPQPGQNLTVTVDGDVLEAIEEGATADVTVKLGLIKLLQKTFDICEEARNANATVQCPVAPGTYSVSQTVELPKEIPKAKFQINVRGYTAEEADMLCLDLFVDFMSKKPGSVTLN